MRSRVAVQGLRAYAGGARVRSSRGFSNSTKYEKTSHNQIVTRYAAISGKKLTLKQMMDYGQRMTPGTPGPTRTTPRAALMRTAAAFPRPCDFALGWVGSGGPAERRTTRPAAHDPGCARGGFICVIHT